MKSTQIFWNSSVGKKALMGLSGLALVLFSIAHLSGNLSLYSRSGENFNRYAAFLHSFGPMVVVAEVGLVFLFGAHILTGILVSRANRAARPGRYKMEVSKGGPSFSSPASKNMIITGSVLLAFVVVHILQFRFGPGVEQGYVTTVDGKQARDLHKLVVEVFANPLWVGFYVFAMALFGMHLRHGFWSAFQSLGAMRDDLRKPFYLVGLFIALILAVGFLFIPIFLFVNQGGH